MQVVSVVLFIIDSMCYRSGIYPDTYRRRVSVSNPVPPRSPNQSQQEGKCKALHVQNS